MRRIVLRIGALAVPVLLLALAGCGTENKIGSTIKGTRIAVMEQSKTLQADKDLATSKPNLSPVVNNMSWPQAGYDVSHMMPNADVRPFVETIWHSDVGDGSDSDFKLLARPVIGNGKIFTMDSQGDVKAFNAANGDRLWEFDTTPPDRDENAIAGGLGVNGDTLYVTTGFGEVLALRIDTGAVRWRHFVLNPVRAAPSIADGHVYVVSIDNQLTALDAQTGSELWHQNGIAESATLMGASNPAIDGDNVVVAYSSGEIFNLREQNGRVLWNYALTTPTQVGALPAIADIRGLPAVDKGVVYAISHSGRMAAIDQRTGDRIWEADVGGINTPVVSGDMIYVLTNDMQLVALARDSGRIAWVHQMQQQEDPEDHDSDKVFWTGPVLAGNRLWLVNSLGQLMNVAADGSDNAATVELRQPVYIPPVFANGIVYAVTDDGTLIALR